MLVKQNADLMQENRDAFAIVKEMLMKQSLDDHKLRKERLEYERSTKERAKWMTFLPALVNSLAGREIFPQGTADTALVESIADALPPEAMGQIAAMLPPEVMGVIAGRLTEIVERKNRERAELARTEDEMITEKESEK
jgi:hypothetical protein